MHRPDELREQAPVTGLRGWERGQLELSRDRAYLAWERWAQRSLPESSTNLVWAATEQAAWLAPAAFRRVAWVWCRQREARDDD